MRRLHLAELRDSWSAWLGVCVAFVVTNFALTLATLTMVSGLAAVRAGRLDILESAAFVFMPGANLIFCAIVGAVVIGSATSLVVDSRRGSLARLALNGATPAQVVSTIMSQLAVVSLACSAVGCAVAYAALPGTLTALAYARRSDEGLAAPAPVYAGWPVALAVVFAAGLALLGGLKQARAASEIPPVEALRQSATGRDEPMTVGRWVRAGLCLLVVVGTYAAIPALTADPSKETLSNLIIADTALLVIIAALLAQLAPLIVGPLTRAWTRLVPTLDPSWTLARATVVTKASRLSKSVVPVMMAIGLTFGMVAIGGILLGSLRATGYDTSQLSGTGIGTTATLLGMPLLIALSGGVGSLIMMAKQRSAELALSGIVGTTPTQRVLISVSEGVIIAGTGALLAVVMVAAGIGFLALGIPAAGVPFAFVPSYLTFLITLAVSVVVTVAATVLPTLPSLRLPEPRVIARLVAE